MLSRRKYRQIFLIQTMTKNLKDKDGIRLVNLFLRNESNEKKICVQYKNTIYNDVSFLINHTDIITYRNIVDSKYDGFNKISIVHCIITAYENSYFIPFKLKFQMTPRKIRMSHGLYKCLYDELEMDLQDHTGFVTPALRDTMIASIYEFIHQIKRQSSLLFEDETVDLDYNIVNNNTLIMSNTYKKCIEMYRKKLELLSYTRNMCKCQIFRTANLHLCVCNFDIPDKFW